METTGQLLGFECVQVVFLIADLKGFASPKRPTDPTHSNMRQISPSSRKEHMGRLGDAAKNRELSLLQHWTTG